MKRGFTCGKHGGTAVYRKCSTPQNRLVSPGGPGRSIATSSREPKLQRKRPPASVEGAAPSLPGVADTRTDGPEFTPAQARWAIAAIFWVLAYQGFTVSINGIGAPFIARTFHLDDAGIATLYAWIAPAALGVLFLSRLADRLGRRRVLLACMLATPLAAVAAATARSVVLFAICDILLYAFIGGAVSISVVMLAELLPMGGRAGGQSRGGLATAVGSGVCLVLMPLLDKGGHSWRWLLVISGSGLVCLPLLAWAIPESPRWRHAAAGGATREGGLLDVFRAPHRRRTLPIVACGFLSVMAAGSVEGWGYYHVVSVVGLSAGAASALILVGGGVGLLGFPLGAWACERLGRVPTVVISWALASGGALAFYWGPPTSASVPALWLGAAFFWFIAAGNAAIVGFRAASTELFPTALRGTMIGVSALVGAVGAVSAQTTIALLAGPLGGLSTVVGYLALLAIPGAIIFGLFIDETRGLTLEVAAGEEPGRAPAAK